MKKLLALALCVMLLLTSVNACCKRPANFKPANRIDPQALSLL